MKTFQEFKTFYENDLKQKCLALEEERKDARKDAVFIIIATVLITGSISAFGLYVFLKYHWHGAIIAAPIFLGIVFGIRVHRSRIKKFARKFKNQIIKPIIEFVDPGFEYQAYGYLSKSTFERSELFKERPNIYSGDDLVKGKLGKTSFIFSELHAKVEKGSGKNRQVYPIFDGLLFIADFNKKFDSKTFVLPDKAEKYLGIIGKFMQSKNFTRPDLVKLENPEFEKSFVVYSEDQVEARYILSTNFMEKILEYNQKTKKDILLSFIDDKIYIAIPDDKKFFEPRLDMELSNLYRMNDYFQDLNLAISLIEDFNLNRRIWGKK
ncbi:MAG: DUF3137 domain-containing protein [Pseudomonadota bacterium]